MKNGLIIVSMLLIQAGAIAQVKGHKKIFPVKGQLVTVNDWGSRSIVLFCSFFQEIRDSIIAQIGEQEFKEMENKCSNAGWPGGFYDANLDEEEDIAFDKKLNELKMYQVACYTHKYNGKTFDRYVVLRIPAEENKMWKPAVQWSGNIYFLLKEKDVQLVK